MNRISLTRRLLALQASAFIHSNTRTRLLKMADLIIGPNARILSGVFFSSSKFEIGEGSFINQGCHIDNTNEWVRIGRNVQIGPSVNLITSAHEISGPECRAGVQHPRPVTIEDGCWLGAACTLLPGVNAAKGCVIGAGALVTKSTKPNGLYLGVPAVRVRDLD